MEVISPSRASSRPFLVPLLAPTIIGTTLVVAGLSLAYLAFATPALSLVLPTGRPSAGQMAAGMAIWAFALVAPAACVLAGANRLARLLAAVRARVGQHSPVHRALAGVPDVVVATGLMLPDGRGVPDLVLGPFGAVVVRDLPPTGITRVHQGAWQLRTKRGWIPLENPLERTVRDADRVRRWLAHDDTDFVVKVYAAVVGPAPTVPRTSSCAVLTPDQLVPWVAALPGQRSLTAGRRERMLDLVREAAGSTRT